MLSLTIVGDWYLRFWKFVIFSLGQFSNPLNLWNLLFPKKNYPDPESNLTLPLDRDNPNYANKTLFNVLDQKEKPNSGVVRFLNIGYLNLSNHVFSLVLQFIDETNNIAKYEAIRIYNLNDNADYVWDRYIIHSPWSIIDKLYMVKIDYSYKGIELSRDEGYIEYLKKLENDEDSDLEQLNSEIEEIWDEPSIKRARKRKVDESLNSHKRREPNLIDRGSTKVDLDYGSISPNNHLSKPHNESGSKPKIVSKFKIDSNNQTDIIPKKIEDTLGTTRVFKAVKPSEPIKERIEILTYKSKPTTYLKTSTPQKTKRFKIRVKSKKIKIDNDYVLKIIEEIRNIIPQNYDDGSLAPVLLRLAWHCCATFDINSNTGGSNGGTMRFVPEITDEGNNGLDIARGALEPIKQKFPLISYSDLWTLAGKVAIESMGGPIINWKTGRVDHKTNKFVPPNGRLPFADKGADHIRTTFGRMGFSDKEAVILLGAHAVGRCHKRISGWEGKWTENPIKFSNEFYKVLINEVWELGEVPESGRQQYFNQDKSLMMLNTDLQLIIDPIFKPFVQMYAANESLYFKDFAATFEKLLELGINRNENDEIIH